MKLEMQIKFSGSMRTLSSESFISLFTKQRIQEKNVLHTTVTVPGYVQGRKTWSLTLRENRMMAFQDTVLRKFIYWRGNNYIMINLLVVGQNVVQKLPPIRVKVTVTPRHAYANKGISPTH
jgi:hypothetical protein